MARHEHAPDSCTDSLLADELVEKDIDGTLRIRKTGTREEMIVMRRSIEHAWPGRYALDLQPCGDGSGRWMLCLIHRPA